MQVKVRATFCRPNNHSDGQSPPPSQISEHTKRSQNMKKEKNRESIERRKEKNADFKPNSEGSDKQKFALYITQESMDAINDIYKTDNCSSRSEFIEKGVKFYIGFLRASESVNYISPLLTAMLNSTVMNSEQRINRNLFKIAVELGKLSHMVAAANEVDDETVRDLHRMCVEEVRRINGVISAESAVKFQQD